MSSPVTLGYSLTHLRSTQCRKLLPATDNYTTLHVIVPTKGAMEDISPYSRTQATTKTNANQKFLLGFMKTSY